MKAATKAALMIAVLGAVAVGALWLLLPMFREAEKKAQEEQAERQLYETSDAQATTTIRVGGDGYLGYWFASTAPEMRKLSLRRGIKVDFTDDGGASADRLAKFNRDEYDAIVLPVNSYLEHGAPYKTGVIVAGVAQSLGADGILGFADKFPAGTVNELNDESLRGVYIPNSPNSFMIDLATASFDLSHLAASNDWRVEVGSPDEVLQKAKKREGDFFVLWEPELSRALTEVPGLKPIFASDQFRGYIVDVFVFRRDFLQQNETAAKAFFESYFQVLRSYSSNRSKLLDDLTRTTGLKLEVAQQMLEKIDWFDLYENCSEQFGIATQLGGAASDGLVNCILACADVLNRTSRKNNPIDVDPYFITNSKLLEGLLASAPAQLGGGGKKIDFKPITDEQWRKLREIGVMRVEPVKFDTDESSLTPEGIEQVETIFTMLENNFPEHRVEVRGHTASGHDEVELQKLSLARAQMVVQRLTALGIDPDRLRAVGMGSQVDPTLKPGETRNSRMFKYRKQRVEFVLFQGNNL